MSGWFDRLFGFQEIASASRGRNGIPINPGLRIHQNFEVSNLDSSPYQILTSKVNEKVFIIGKFSTPSLVELRKKGISIISNNAPVLNLKSVNIEHIVVNDLVKLHFENRGAIFQAASQFNCLEFSNPRAVPELGVEIYEFDRTQGPACAIACAAGTVFRNYFAPIDLPVGSTQYGQTSECQINTLKDLEDMLGNQKYWYITNGYSFSDSESLLRMKTAFGSQNTNNLRDAIRIGVHEHVGVTFSSFEMQPTNLSSAECPCVTQVYCSALSCGYSGVHNSLWEPLARLVLEAAYEATLWEAVIYQSSIYSQSKDVFLTFLGGGVFKNDLDWILDAMARAVAILTVHGAEMNIKICHYRSLNENIVTIFKGKFEFWLNKLEQPEKTENI